MEWELLVDEVALALDGAALERDAVADAVHAGRGSSGRAPAALREEIDSVLQDSPLFTETADGLVYVPALLDGTSWVAPIDPDDTATTWSDGTRYDGSSHDVPGEFVRVDPHLTPLSWWLVDGGVPLVDGDGHEIDELATDGIWLDDADTEVVYANEGWLDGVGPWARFAVRDGAIELTSLAEPPPVDAAQAAALSAAFDRVVETHELIVLDEEPVELRFVGLERLVDTALYDAPDAFRDAPTAPIPELLAAAGLEMRNTLVARTGFDWDALRAWQRRNKYRSLYGLDDDQIDGLVLMIGAALTYGDEGVAAFGETDDERVAAMALFAAMLDDSAVAGAFQTEISERTRLETVADFVGELVALFEGDDIELPGVAWMHASCVEAAGDAVAADTILRQALTTSTTHALALSTAARFAADRGDAPAAHQLLVRAGVEPYEPPDEQMRWWSDQPSEAQRLLDEVEPYVRRRPRRDVGRNDPCPCGSGRKYKACHLGKDDTPLTERAPWLADKALRHARTMWSAEIRQVARAMAVHEPGAQWELEDSPFVIDLVLHELGGFADFLERRGPLLPDDEQLLAAQWSLADLGVFDVESVKRGGAGGELRLRNIGTGDIVEVHGIDGQDRLGAGTVLVGRPVPVGDALRTFSGFFPVPRAHANTLIDAIGAGDLDALVGTIALLFKPPTLQNTDGDDMEIHVTTWHCDASADAVAERLAASGFVGGEAVDPDGAVTGWHLVRDTANNEDTVVASVVVSAGEAGTTLVGEVNSAERGEELLDAIAAAVPDASVVDHRVHDPGDVAPGDGLDDAAPEVVPSGDPAVQDAVAAMMARHEERWIDEQIPALGGRTPREAVADPIGRVEVEHLLASFTPPEQGSGIVAMNPDRLRELLGL